MLCKANGHTCRYIDASDVSVEGLHVVFLSLSSPVYQVEIICLAFV